LLAQLALLRIYVLGFDSVLVRHVAYRLLLLLRRFARALLGMRLLRDLKASLRLLRLLKLQALLRQCHLVWLKLLNVQMLRSLWMSILLIVAMMLRVHVMGRLLPVQIVALALSSGRLLLRMPLVRVLLHRRLLIVLLPHELMLGLVLKLHL
jgi:hypothetical protein